MQPDGVHFCHFVEKGNWTEYLNKLSRPGEWGDHIAVYALSKMLQRTIRIVSSADTQNYDLVLDNDYDKPEPLLVGHVSEVHYHSLEPRTDLNNHPTRMNNEVRQ